MVEPETPSDSQLTDEQRRRVDELYQQDRDMDWLEDQRTDKQPAKDDPATTRD